MREEIKRKYNDLIEWVKEASVAYYELDEPLYTDEEFDNKYDQLIELEKEYPEIKRNDSPTNKVGGDTSTKFVRKKHTIPMLSLDKAQDKNRIEKFMNDTKSPKYVLEWKYDGLAFVARYEDGVFVEARTRGNGIEGEIITEQVKMIDTIPKNIDLKGVLEVSGEVYMPYKSYEAYNNEQIKLIEEHSQQLGEETAIKRYPLLQNPRNGAAGAIRQLNSKVTKERNLEAAAFNVLLADKINKEMPKDQLEVKRFLDDLGFNTTLMLESYSIKDKESLMKRLDECEKKRARLPFEVDGLVLKVNDKELQEEIGYTNKFPKWAIAYKFEAVEKSTILKRVDWEVGRTGRVTPVAILEDIDFDGVVVTKATLNNPSFIQSLGLKENCEVVVRRSNDVIPQIMSVLGKPTGNEIKVPAKCPVCHNDLSYEAPLLFCENDLGCDAQIKTKIEHFASRDAMDIEGLSEKTVEQLLENNLIQDVSDIYLLTKEELLKLERFGPKKADNLLRAIEDSKNIEWNRFVYALGLPNIGRRASKLLCERYKNMDDLMNSTVEELIEIDTFAEKTANGIRYFLDSSINQLLIKKLYDNGIECFIEEVEQSENNVHLNGKSFVITGKLTESRSYYKKIIEDSGGVVRGSVSKKTDYVLAGEEAGSKLDKAKSINVSVLSEDDFNDMIQT